MSSPKEPFPKFSEEISRLAYKETTFASTDSEDDKPLEMSKKTKKPGLTINTNPTHAGPSTPTPPLRTSTTTNSDITRSSRSYSADAEIPTGASSVNQDSTFDTPLTRPSKTTRVQLNTAKRLSEPNPSLGPLESFIQHILTIECHDEKELRLKQEFRLADADYKNAADAYAFWARMKGRMSDIKATMISTERWSLEKEIEEKIELRKRIAKELWGWIDGEDDYLEAADGENLSGSASEHGSGNNLKGAMGKESQGGSASASGSGSGQGKGKEKEEDREEKPQILGRLKSP